MNPPNPAIRDYSNGPSNPGKPPGSAFFTADYFDEWRREATKVVVLAGAFILVTTLGGLSMLKAWRTLERRTEDLARSNADLEQFAFVASHDLQTPLRHITSYAQLLSRRYRGRLDSDADDFIDFIVGGTKRMSVMIPELLNYARVSTMTSEVGPVDLRRIIDATLIELGPTIEASGATVNVGTLPIILGEEHLVQSLFRNLIENALIYRHPDRPPAIEISAEAAGDGFWRLAVRDNGIGIEPIYFEKIFIIFQRLDPHSYPDGTGIGLALCRRLVHRFGGTIWLESTPDKGTTFFFTLRGSPVSGG